jgi:phage terminase small subunit
MAQTKAQPRPKNPASKAKGDGATKQVGRTRAKDQSSEGITPQQERFCREFVIDDNATQAAIRAGYSERSARTQAADLLAKPNIAEVIHRLRKERATRTDITADRVLTEAWNIATADPRELVEYRIGCCRHCYGKDHRYQRTAAEFERDESEHSARCEKAIMDGKPHPGEFDPKGGTGFNKLTEPNPECPECFGEGLGRTVFKDTSKVSKATASLFAGVKETKDGLEIKLHSKDGALEKLFKHLGLYERDNEQRTEVGQIRKENLTDAERAVRLFGLLSKGAK